jgi:O-acetyl-ADP-ribose deacetylase (regulator of RNase III)
MTKIKIVDINSAVIAACKGLFSPYEGEVECILGDITDQEVDVWVTPTNSLGNMSGGVDYSIKNKLGLGIQARIKDVIEVMHNGHLPVGKAVIVTTGIQYPKYVVATPSMVGETDNLTRTKNTALACAAAFQAIYQAKDKYGQPIESIAIPGLGSGTGQVPPMTCAELMLIGFKLFRRKRYTSFSDMVYHLNEELSHIGYYGAADEEFFNLSKDTEPESLNEISDKDDPVLTQQAEKEYAFETLSAEHPNVFEDSLNTQVNKPVSSSTSYIDKMPIGTRIV